ncbi:MAG: hypothetical protein J6R42_03700 [Clostridia bacterium]|nr:hypothetical protein [Clostridia bacterium]
MMFHTSKQKAMSPLCTAAVTVLAVAGAVSLGMLLKKKAGSMAKQMKKFGCECADAMEEGMAQFCEDDQCPLGE